MGRGGQNNLLNSIQPQWGKMTTNKQLNALIIVDVQYDFLPGGALAVPNGDEVIAPLLRAANKASYVFASRDWHPVNHSSFKENGGIWPQHCVAGTRGAELADQIKQLVASDFIIDKATTVDKDAYSAFNGTNLDYKLKNLGVKNLLIGGLATDYCVKQTVLDARKLGYKVKVLKDCCRGVNLQPDDSLKAYQEMAKTGSLLE